MSETIERLKAGLVEAQRRNAEIAKRWQAMQAEYGASNAEVSGYQKVLELETKKELEEAAAAAPATNTEPKSERTTAAPNTQKETNKTQVIRDALAEHPNVTPVQLWGAVREKVPNRNYVYSVLARLHAKDEVTVRRGRYSIKQVTAPEEGEAKQQTLQ